MTSDLNTNTCTFRHKCTQMCTPIHRGGRREEKHQCINLPVDFIEKLKTCSSGYDSRELPGGCKCGHEGEDKIEHCLRSVPSTLQPCHSEALSVLIRVHQASVWSWCFAKQTFCIVPNCSWCSRSNWLGFWPGVRKTGYDPVWYPWHPPLLEWGRALPGAVPLVRHQSEGPVSGRMIIRIRIMLIKNGHQNIGESFTSKLLNF